MPEGMWLGRDSWDGTALRKLGYCHCPTASLRKESAAWTQHSGCSEVDEAPFTSYMGGGILGQGLSSVCYVLSWVLHFKPGLLGSSTRYWRREGKGKGLKDALVTAYDCTRWPTLGCLTSDPIIFVMWPHGLAAWSGPRSLGGQFVE